VGLQKGFVSVEPAIWSEASQAANKSWLSLLPFVPSEE